MQLYFMKLGHTNMSELMVYQEKHLKRSKKEPNQNKTKSLLVTFYLALKQWGHRILEK